MGRRSAGRTSPPSPSPAPSTLRPGGAAGRRHSIPVFPSEFSGLERLVRASGHEPVRVEILAGDVGRRRYVRVALADRRTVLGVAYPAEEMDSCRRWLEARAALAPHVRVPDLIAEDREGNQLVEDLGVEDLATRLAARPESRAENLGHAARAAAMIAGIPDPAINPSFDFALFRRELELAREAVFDLYLEQPLSPADREAHDRWADALCREILVHPRALCHRDFHGNNLFPLEEGIAAIDFQDLRSGPDSYDLASLLWERTTLEWMTPALAEETIGQFSERRRLDAAALSRRLGRVLLQRAWKVCGTFARAVACGRGEVYRRYLPGEMALVGRLLGVSGEDRPFRRVYDARLAPLLS